MTHNHLNRFYTLLFFLCLLLSFTVIAEINKQQTFTTEEVSKHNSASDCWLIIRGEVYDVTNYLALHPTSPGAIEPWCGSIANDGMETKGIGVDHSEEAYNLLSQYLIGKLE